MHSSGINDLAPLPRGMHRRVGLIANPTSAKGKAGGSAGEVHRILAHLGYEVALATGSNYQHTKLSASALLHDPLGVDALIVVGGDGTVHLGVEVTANSTVPLGIVPVGTGNDIARQIGVAGHDIAAAIRVIHYALNRENKITAALDAIHCTKPDGTAVDSAHQWCLASVCAGFDAAVNARANTLRWPAGGGRYLLSIPYELRNFVPYGYRVTTDSGTWQGGALLLTVANTKFIGGGLPIAPQADPKDGLLEVIRLDAASRFELLTHLYRLARGTHLQHKKVHYERSRIVTIEPLTEKSKWRRPPRPMADGEFIADLPLRLEAVKNAIHLLVPATYADKIETRSA